MDLRSYTPGGACSGLDGSGVGIAVLDSGVMWNHTNFMAGNSRIKRAVDLQKAGDGSAAGVKGWTKGIDASAGLTPGSPALGTYEALPPANTTSAS